jgi:hypothetical protein
LRAFCKPAQKILSWPFFALMAVAPASGFA